MDVCDRVLEGVRQPNAGGSALESSYSTEHLRKMVASGMIPNSGERGRPRIRRGDLPVKRTNGSSLSSPENDVRDFLQKQQAGA